MLLWLYQGMEQLVKELISVPFVIGRHHKMLHIVPDVLNVRVFFCQCRHMIIPPFLVLVLLPVVCRIIVFHKGVFCWNLCRFRLLQSYE